MKKIYGIGVGPGDPELLTVKAVRLLRECDIIGIPAKDRDSCTAYGIARSAVPEIDAKPVVEVPVPMTADRERLNDVYDTGCRALTEQLQKGKSIAFLNLGDPTIYGSYMELHWRITEAGFQSELVSGVPSFCAVAAAVGVPLGVGKEAIHILPGQCSIEEITETAGTRILMKSGGRIEQIKECLTELEKKGISVCAVANCGMENQVIYPDIRKLDEQPGYFTTILVTQSRDSEGDEEDESGNDYDDNSDSCFRCHLAGSTFCKGAEEGRKR
ncbi:MAG: precorrin-2 C(20)-methyltransferase [Clostridium sp.]|nr:precorrin-2 C(20)-methyltransferase [Clostridium sp.]